MQLHVNRRLWRHVRYFEFRTVWNWQVQYCHFVILQIRKLNAEEQKCQRSRECNIICVGKSARFRCSHGLVRVCVCVYLYVCLSIWYNRSHRSHISENQKCKRIYFDFNILHRMVSLLKLYSVTFTYIFDFKCSKCVKFVYFRMEPER